MRRIVRRLGVMACLLVPCAGFAGDMYVERSRLPSEHATQAAAADEHFVYAVAGKVIAKYDRTSGLLLGLSTGEASHLNSAFLNEGEVYCAHSNFPFKPEKGDIRVFDPETLKLSVFHSFTNPPGSVTWVLKREGGWWCHFAHYGPDNGRSVLVRYDVDWKETGRWSYPAELVKEWGAASLSGAVWQGDTLLAIGHDKKELYRLKLPTEGTTMQWLDTVACPFPGQGIAVDSKTGGLVGIDRAKKAVVFATLEKSPAR